jgi:superfamily II DNA or RNA helicase
MLTLQGYKISKSLLDKEHHIKGLLSVKPYIPSVFVKPQYVQRFEVFREDTDSLYVPKHFGIEKFGAYGSTTRDVPQTDPKYWEFAGSIREAQRPVVDSFLLPEPHDGIISLQTGGGKTVCGLYIASQLKLPTLVLVHSGFLKDQWVERISAFLPKARIGTIQGEVFDIENKDIVVGMLQSIALKEHPPNHFKRFGLVIVDECHHIASEGFSQAVPKLTSKYMLGLSATPERKDRLMHVIHWFLGPLLYVSNTAEKVDDKVNVEVYEFEGDEKHNEIIYNNAGVMFSTLMVNKVAENSERNKLLVSILEDVFDDEDRQILVLSDRVEHVKALYGLLPDRLREKAGILARGMKPAVREEFCSQKRILIATYQLCKEGFDCASLNTLMMATSRPDVVQIVGRILRVEKSKRTTEPLIIDVVDVPFRRQFQERLKLYKERNYKVQKMKIE